MRQWFLARLNQEQVIIVLLAIVLVLFLVWQMFLEPMSEKQQQLETRQQALSNQLQQVQQLVERHQQLEQQGESSVQTSQQSLANLVNSSVIKHGLTLRRYQPSSSSGVAQIRFENMPFSSIISWLYDLEVEQGVGIKDLSITDGQSGGLVNVSVRLYISA